MAARQEQARQFQIDLQKPTMPKKQSKYHAQPTTVDGIRFDSKKEATRYAELKLEQQAGTIANLEIQPQFPIVVTDPHGIRVAVGSYRADFRYIRNNGVVVEDVKGKATATTAYKLRKRLIETIYGITILEI